VCWGQFRGVGSQTPGRRFRAGFSLLIPPISCNRIKKEIAAGKNDTWAFDKDGDFFHTPAQWRSLAWLRPVNQGDRLIFQILSPKGKVMTSETYAVYHGRFIEMLLAHFDMKFSDARATALPAHGDIVGTASG
jgi:hypothetical protein